MDTKINTKIKCLIQLRSLLNPFKAQIISWLNLLTDTNDAVYNGISPTNIEIELAVDLINGQII